MVEYLNLLKNVLENGTKKKDRTGIGTISLFGTQTRYNLKKGFPLLTTKKTHFKSIFHELLWFIKGETNIKYLVDNDVKIWNEWPYEIFKKSSDFNGETISEYAKKIKNSNVFAKKHGNLGPVYGKQWRNFNGVDQLKDAIKNIKKNSISRRIIISSWNPPEIKKMLLPPCHTFIQFYVKDNKLSTLLYQRSADVFLGVPFNIASYALLTHLIAQVTKLEVNEFIHTTGDTHIYLNHIEQINEQLKRNPRSLPKLRLNAKIENILDFTYDDIEIENYDSYPAIKGKVAI